MYRRLTITLDEEVYQALHAVVGRRRSSRFIEALLRPYVLGEDLHSGYRQMAEDALREAEAEEWVDSMIADVSKPPA